MDCDIIKTKKLSIIDKGKAQEVVNDPYLLALQLDERINTQRQELVECVLDTFYKQLRDAQSFTFNIAVIVTDPHTVHQKDPELCTLIKDILKDKGFVNCDVTLNKKPFSHPLAPKCDVPFCRAAHHQTKSLASHIGQSCLLTIALLGIPLLTWMPQSLYHIKRHRREKKAYKQKLCKYNDEDIKKIQFTLSGSLPRIT